MLLLFLIVGVVIWASGALLVVALCRGARLGDDAELPLELSDMRPGTPLALVTGDRGLRRLEGAPRSRGCDLHRGAGLGGRAGVRPGR